MPPQASNAKSAHGGGTGRRDERRPSGRSADGGGERVAARAIGRARADPAGPLAPRGDLRPNGDTCRSAHRHADPSGHADEHDRRHVGTSTRRAQAKTKDLHTFTRNARLFSRRRCGRRGRHSSHLRRDERPLCRPFDLPLDSARHERPPPSDGGADADDARPPAARVWRVASLAQTPGFDLFHGTVGKRALHTALLAAGIPKGETARIYSAFDGVHSLERLHPHDTFIAARERSSGHIVAFELATSPLDVWQAKIDGLGDPDGGAPALESDLRAAKLDLNVAHSRVAVAVAVGDDLRASLIAAGLDDDLLEMLDDALDGHAELSDLRSGARLRIVAGEDRVDGAFARYSELDAVEYFPPGGHAPPVRVYWFVHEGAHHAGGYFDKKGHQPYHGAWRAPIPFARITSRFDMHRMHPVLHVVMPHNGVDFGATSGTPIYAAATGTVSSANDSGACGNMVVIRHENNLASGYCHMSRFASGLRAGQHVEARQLIGYVGATGRVTGPHLHFWVKRGDTFIDPLSLRLDGVRVLPPGDRDDFAARREELDQALDGISLPAAGDWDGGAGGDRDGGEGEMFYEEPP